MKIALPVVAETVSAQDKRHKAVLGSVLESYINSGPNLQHHLKMMNLRENVSWRLTLLDQEKASENCHIELK